MKHKSQIIKDLWENLTKKSRTDFTKLAGESTKFTTILQTAILILVSQFQEEDHRWVQILYFQKYPSELIKKLINNRSWT